MKVFFTTTPRLKVESPGAIEQIYETLEKLGHDLTSDYLRHVDTDEFYKVDNEKVPVFYDEILDALKKSEVVVFEASLHSIGVGILIREALEMNKGVVILHKKGHFPFFLGGIKDERFVIVEYDEVGLRSVLESAFEYLSGAVDVRFNFFISPAIGRYLDWIAKHKRLPRAVYLRRLIESDMKENKEYAKEA